MASYTIEGMEEFEQQLSRLAADADRVAKEALEAAAGIVAERVRLNLEALREDYQWKPYPAQPYRHLPEGGKFSGIPPHQKEDLLNAFGITRTGVDDNGDWTVSIGFKDGYGSQPTRTYPNGQPILLIARSVESGSSIQPKQPFFRRAVEATRKRAVEAMDRIIAEATEKIVK